MKRALVLFGSTSDKKTYDKIFENLKDTFELDLKVLSAHRNPDELEIELRKNNFDFIIAGAGIAAHLPGVCASKTNKPVFGVPVTSYLEGLDAYLSIAQMPFGVPVATVFEDNINALKNIYQRYTNINIYWDKSIEHIDTYNAEMIRTRSWVESEKLNITYSHEYQANHINIKLVNRIEEVDPNLDEVLYVPILSKEEKNNMMSALTILKAAKKNGLWFGTNNTRNAIKFASRLTC